jgi:hypothetical protein
MAGAMPLVCTQSVHVHNRITRRRLIAARALYVRRQTTISSTSLPRFARTHIHTYSCSPRRPFLFCERLSLSHSALYAGGPAIDFLPPTGLCKIMRHGVELKSCNFAILSRFCAETKDLINIFTAPDRKSFFLGCFLTNHAVTAYIRRMQMGLRFVDVCKYFYYLR